MVTVQDAGKMGDVTIQFDDTSHGSITLEGVGSGNYSSIQDLLDTGMNIDINNENI